MPPSLGHLLGNMKEQFLPALLERGQAVLRSRRFALLIALAAIASVMATYITVTQRGGDVEIVYLLLNLDIVLLLLLGTIVARRLVVLWSRRKAGVAGARLHARFVFIFGLLAAVPAILMAVFSAVFFYFGVQAWFNDRVKTAVNESLQVAQAYLSEHQQVMRADILAMANDMTREALVLNDNQRAMDQMVRTQSYIRNLPEVVVFTSVGKVLARSHLSFLPSSLFISDDNLDKAKSGEVVMITDPEDDENPVDDNRLRALVKLNGFVDTYLFVGRQVDGQVLEHMETVEKAVAEYTALDGRRSQVQMSMTLLFMAVSFLLLLAAIWAGFFLAEGMTQPIAALIRGAEKVRKGDLSVRISETGREDEMDVLARAFNRMTHQIQSQRDELISTNRILDERRRFTEAVLAGASSGVVGLDAEGRITLANARAAQLLDYKFEALAGQSFLDILPEAAPLLNGETEKGQMQIDLAQKRDASVRTLLIRLTEPSDKSGDMVVTFDDISALVTAERKAAWADVARRIAHEIKNPLTPIQLSAERLRRRYLKQIKKDPEIFEECIDTIGRQVKDIGRMVKSFSAFARMPEPVKQVENFLDIVKDALVLQQQGREKIKFDVQYPRVKNVPVYCDRGQIGQVLTNLIQNGVDAIADAGRKKGEILVQIKYSKKNNEVSVIVEDNGTGLPDKTQQELLEPYVTTKQKGSGLGLAIVKKILEDHDGGITLEGRGKKHGARAEIRLPLYQENEA
ncbi:MAG: PAS domain-containing sensor histidine kinase [Proteobacteria bacterium]|nr:PAS domain-containing sensor histidine kinase [Pseudomonadota bacterium]